MKFKNRFSLFLVTLLIISFFFLALPETGYSGAADPCCGVVAPTPIPTLSQWGLLAMAGILGIVGFMVIRRRRKATT